MSRYPLNQSAVGQVADTALVDEVNRRLKLGQIKPDALTIPKDDDAAGGGYA